MSSVTNPPRGKFIPESGMTEEHFRAFQDAAHEEGVVALVRLTNVKSTELIAKGCPGKPKGIDFHTSVTTGVVTAANGQEIASAQEKGYLIVQPGNKLASGYFMQNGRRVEKELKLTNPFWKVEPGQLIDPKLMKPLVGDYDLHGVFAANNPGSNLAMVQNHGKMLDSIESPIVKRFKNSVNPKLDMPRVHHGAQDQFAGFRGGAIVFLADRQAFLLADEAAVEEFYNAVGRQTRVGKYASAPPVLRNGIRVLPVRSLNITPRNKGRALAGNQAAMEWIGQSLGGMIQAIGDIGIRRNIQRELLTTHAEFIEESLAAGIGVLVIANMQEWLIPDFNGMRARGLLGVYVEAGATLDQAIDRWREPKYLEGPAFGWRRYEEYIWIDPKS